MVPLAYIAQHVWEVGASVFAVLLVGQGLFYLITGIRMPWAEGMSPRAVRTRAGLSVLLGVGVGFAAFFVDAETTRRAWRQWLGRDAGNSHFVRLGCAHAGVLCISIHEGQATQEVGRIGHAASCAARALEGPGQLGEEREAAYLYVVD